MSRKINITSYIITLALTLATLFVAVFIFNGRYGGNMVEALLKIAVGAIVAGFISTLIHELGHVFAGKKNGFAFSSMSVWFFCWKKVRNKIKFNFIMMGEEAGYTEMIAKSPDNMERKLAKMTRGGIIASFILMLIGLPPLFLAFLPEWVYSIWVMFLPIGAYYFFGTALPASNYGVRNDGAVLYGLKKADDNSKVAVNLLIIQSHAYNGKTPSEIDKSLYFDLPQLPEDDPLFVALLDARYNYYIDIGDYENAKKIIQRELSLEEYMPKYYISMVKTQALYSACTFDFNEETADDLMYELEKYLNNVNTATTIRVKLAYLINVRREKDGLDIFFKKGYKEADKCQISGLGRFERKLIEQLENKI